MDQLMPEFKYVPDQEIEIHREQAIRLLITDFSSHENGLPELIKNASDQYAREDAPEEKRVVVVLFDFGRKNIRPSISCLDFCGMTSEVIERNFRVWFDPEAAHRGAVRTARQRLGGHGNGGKSYMCNMFSDYAILHTVRDGHGCRYGVRAGSVTFGYVPSPEEGRSFPVKSLDEDLASALAQVRCSLTSLPREAHTALRSACGFTLVRGVGPKYYEQRFPYEELIRSLESHPQMIQPLEFCKIFVLVNGRLGNGGLPLSVPKISPLEGGEAPRMIEVPENLLDPETGSTISTTLKKTKERGSLKLCTSAKDMRWNKGRHIVSFTAESGWIGHVPVTELDIQSPYRNKVYGECYLPALEPFKQNDRARLASSPLTRAVVHFIAEQITEYAREFEARDRKAVSAKERDELSKMNAALDRWKNRLLDRIIHGVWTKGIDEPRPRESLPVGVPVRIEISSMRAFAGRGILFRPRVRFFDAEGRHVQGPKYTWFSENTNVAMVDEEVNVVRTFSHGKTKLWVETLDGGLVSERKDLEVIRIRAVRIEPEEIAVPQGSRRQLRAVCRLSSGQEMEDVYLAWLVNDESVAMVSAEGLVYGHQLGLTDVAAQDEDCEPSFARVIVTQPVSPPDGRSRYPKILVSGSDRDPDTGEIRSFTRDVPPVWQDPQDVARWIWWINTAAPLAELYLNTELDYGCGSEAWRMYHTERYVEILTQIRLTHAPDANDELSLNEWISRWGGGVADIQSEIAAGLKEFITTGKTPEE
jgi:hypothetical protein